MKLVRLVVIPLVVVALACGGSPPQPAEEPPDSSIGLENGSFTVESGGRTIRYEVHGQGPVLMVLTNSWGLSLEGVRELFGALTEKLTVITFDPRGMGGSSPIVEETDMSLAAVREDFHAVRLHLGLETVNAIGWSNGATNLILLGAEDPETFDSLIFVHGAASYGPEDFAEFAAKFPDLAQRYVEFQQEMAAEALSDTDRTAAMKTLWLETYFPTMTGDPQSATPRIEAVFADAEFSWPHSQYATRESPGFDHRSLLGTITAPSLVIAGSHDSLAPERVRELSDGITEATFVVFENSGHFAPIEEPESFAGVVFDFLGVE